MPVPFQRLPRRLAGSSELRGFTPLSAAFRRERRRRADHQPHRDRAAVSLHRDAAQAASRVPPAVHPRTTEVADRVEPGGGGTPAGCGAGLNYKAALSVAYGAGLRASEIIPLKIEDR